jgi:hypothetical protein
MFTLCAPVSHSLMTSGWCCECGWWGLSLVADGCRVTSVASPVAPVVYTCTRVHVPSLHDPSVLVPLTLLHRADLVPNNAYIPNVSSYDVYFSRLVILHAVGWL